MYIICMHVCYSTSVSLKVFWLCCFYGNLNKYYLSIKEKKKEEIYIQGTLQTVKGKRRKVIYIQATDHQG